MFETLSISSKQSIYYTDVKYDREAFLLHDLSIKGMKLSALDSITNLKRRAEWLTIREIVSLVMPENEDIIYNNQKKPYFKNSNSNLSISHSNERVAIYIHQDKNVGIDLQFISDKIFRIKEKFLNAEELDQISMEVNELTAYWSIKEALFKIYGKNDAFLKANFQVKDLQFNGENGTAKGIISVNDFYEEHCLAFRKKDNYMMAYNLNY